MGVVSGIVAAGGGTAGAVVSGPLRGMVGAGAGGEPSVLCSLPGVALRVTRTVSLRSGTAEVFFSGLGFSSSLIELVV